MPILKDEFYRKMSSVFCEFYKKMLGRQDGFGRFLNARRVCCPNLSEICAFFRTNTKMQIQVVKLQLLLSLEKKLNQSFCMFRQILIYFSAGKIGLERIG